MEAHHVFEFQPTGLPADLLLLRSGAREPDLQPLPLVDQLPHSLEKKGMTLAAGEAGREEKPECGVTQALRIGLVASAANRKGGEDGSGADGLAAQKVIAAGIESVETGRIVHLG